MICRRDLGAALSALALSALALPLAGCSDDSGAETRAAGPASNPAVVQLLSQADEALAAGDLAEAGRKLDQGLAAAPDDPDLWVAIARLRFRGGEHLTALEAADRALALGPDHAPALLLRALMVRDAHGAADALPWFEAALAADPDNADAWADYAATLGDGGRNRAMLRAVRKLQALAPDDPRGFYLQAVLAARGGEYTLARSLLGRSGMAARGVPAALLLDGVISLAEGNADSAADTFEALAARQPANARVRELLAKALLEADRHEDLIARFAGEASRAEASPYLMLLVARAYEQIGTRERAAPLLARAYDLRPRPAAVLAPREGLPPPTNAARRVGLAGDWGAAKAGARALSLRFSASADVAALSGDIMLGARDPQAALAAYTRAATIRRPWPLTRKAVLAYRAVGDNAAADTLLARHVAGEPDSANALYALAEQQAAIGAWARTALLLDHAIARGAGHDPALLGLRLRAARALGEAGATRRYAALLAAVRPRRLDKN
jgi:predicted Zn-dependent protease